MSKLLHYLAIGLAFTHSASATCTTPTQRKAWTTLTETEKASYLQAELCLMDPAQAPALTGYKGSKSRWDELQAVHVAQVAYIHTVGAFLPWHRYFMKVHETLLATDCAYTGPLPYWDEQADYAAGPLSEASVFNASTGFGSNLTDSNGCVVDGPFTELTYDLRVNLTRGNAECLTRGLSQSAFDLVQQSQVDACNLLDEYADFNTCIGNDVHVQGHYAVGGVMDDVSLSPADPLFFMHHTNLDRLWWEWQNVNLSTRLDAIGGAVLGVASLQAVTYLPYSMFEPYAGDDGGDVTTLNHTLWMAGILSNVTVAETMDLRGELICAEYV